MNLRSSSWQTPVPASRQRSLNSCFNLLSPARQAGWEWDYQSAAPSSKRMAAISWRMPMTAAARYSNSRCPSPNQRRSMSDKTIIHVIDDDAAMRDSLAFLLDVNGFQPRVYESADAFLKGTGVDAARCVVSDIRMPGMTGV